MCKAYPKQLTDEQDSARFRHLAAIPGVKRYHAHIARYAFEPHPHEAFGIGTIKWGAERYRGAYHVAMVNSLSLKPAAADYRAGYSAGDWRGAGNTR